ncbi:RUN domain-containing protein 1-like [Physella acuta]|uniref:RUN domain-containing protein 1-like n=1 Tax=Physella acuta TaxID=109671 RepID=UPI0027DCC5B3|nr:RUN domain-containing protein 1-like [Physella acuta]XP_059142171.1 RUN domain-containing protein 1-like [Physella acuta]
MATEEPVSARSGKEKINLSDSVDLDADLDYDSFDESGNDRPTERWAPLGAAVSPSPSPYEPRRASDCEELRRLEEEQEQLNSSLLALTTHFAQVQFRLKQIVSAEAEDKETLLKELEEFAFKGIPDVRGCKVQDAQILEEVSEREHEMKIGEQREKQRQLIQQLKSQLEDLETYAYETGDADSLPTSKVMEKQKVVLEELKHKLDLNLENLDSLSTEELCQVVDHAVGQIVNPAKVKEKLVEQLKTQIVDLERFIQFLQGEATSPGPLGKDRCLCPVHEDGQTPASGHHRHGDQKSIGSSSHSKQKNHFSFSGRDKKEDHEHSKHLNESANTIMKKALTVLQIYIISQLGCGSRDFKRNLLKKTAKGNHWGDLRAKLEMAITKCIDLAEKQKQEAKQDTDSEDYSSDSDENTNQSSPALTQCVRKDLAMALRDLMQHGLMEVGQSTSLVPFGCFPSRSAQMTRMLHAWDLFLKYYEMKNGREYNESPARKLSQSFHLDMVGGKPITAKQTFLGAIDTVINSHTPLKRSEDAHLKAFISMALNERKLVTWLRLLFRTQTLIDMYYQDWSYVARTGFEDALRSLERLLVINFNLPVDLAVRTFSNIKDAF